MDSSRYRQARWKCLIRELQHSARRDRAEIIILQYFSASSAYAPARSQAGLLTPHQEARLDLVY
jgi:hypothetical protein